MSRRRATTSLRHGDIATNPTPTTLQMRTSHELTKIHTTDGKAEQKMAASSPFPQRTRFIFCLEPCNMCIPNKPPTSSESEFYTRIHEDARHDQRFRHQQSQPKYCDPQQDGSFSTTILSPVEQSGHEQSVLYGTTHYILPLIQPQYQYYKSLPSSHGCWWSFAPDS
jgi:hypothetical protein